MGDRISFTRFGIAVFLGLWWCTQLATPALAQERVRAKVGIQVRSGERTALAKGAETARAGDFLRVYVVPEEDAYIYVVHNDGKNATLLNAQQAQTRVAKGMSIALPAPDKAYQLDGASAREAITVLCSPTVLSDVTSLFRAPTAPPQPWLALEKTLLDKSKIDLSQGAEKPFQIAGNVRSMSPDPVLASLPIFSGKAFVARKYEFQVQK
ncbi:MAG: DUF4384 domain-containing protein [Candidatus Tectomicrobia bacterium]|uniref:DUF4384 domain-containing protein n=1 Tax=Tectimicrobiota bacterium TaxID=2528274 RepID=A0A937VZC3_UNCTE|nr:DUF4384 domain-containing protein [Candidatus Tectomicrobia bacterium]